MSNFLEVLLKKDNFSILCQVPPTSRQFKKKTFSLTNFVFTYKVSKGKKGPLKILLRQIS